MSRRALQGRRGPSLPRPGLARTGGYANIQSGWVWHHGAVKVAIPNLRAPSSPGLTGRSSNHRTAGWEPPRFCRWRRGLLDRRVKPGNDAVCVTLGRGAGFDELLDDRIHQGLERGVDDVGRDADGGPALAVLVLALDQDPRHRPGAGVEDTHAVVREREAVDVALVLAEVLAQREVERIDRAVALGRRDQLVVADRDLHDREAYSDALARGVDPVLDIDVELGDLEIVGHPPEHASRQQLERRVGRLVGVADRLALLDDVEQAGDARVVLLDGNADALELGEDVRTPRLVGDQDLALVADRFRPHMLVGRGILHDRGGVDAGLGRERAFADIGQMPVRRPVEDFIERVGDVGQVRELVVADADLEALGITGLELEIADQRNDVGVAAALAEAVEGTLNLARAGAHRR